MNLLKDIRDRFAVLLGITVDFLNFTLYGFFTYIFATVFFPDYDTAAHLMFVYGASLIDVISRTAGALVFSWLGDRSGRTKSFKFGAALVLLPSCLIPLLPGYDVIGILAPVILLMARFLQGFCWAELGGSMVYLYESQMNGKYCLSSLSSCAASLGVLLATIIAYVATEHYTAVELQHIGWRMGFGIVSILAILSFLMRWTINETEFFLKIKATHIMTSNPFKNIFLRYYKELLIGFGLICFPATVAIFAFSYSYSYAKGIVGADIFEGLAYNSMLLLFRILVVPPVGFLADRIGGIRILFFACVAGLFSYYFFLVAHSDPHKLLVFLGCITILNSAVVPGIILKIVPHDVRFTMISIVYSIAFIVYGAMVPYVSILLGEIYNVVYIPAMCISISAIITGFAVTMVGLRESNYFSYFPKQLDNNNH